MQLLCLGYGLPVLTSLLAWFLPYSGWSALASHWQLLAPGYPLSGVAGIQTPRSPLYQLSQGPYITAGIASIHSVTINCLWHFKKVLTDTSRIHVFVVTLWYTEDPIQVSTCQPWKFKINLITPLAWVKAMDFTGEKERVSERWEVTAVLFSSAPSERPKEVRVSCRHAGDCRGGRPYVPVKGTCFLCCPAYCGVDVRK